MVEAMSAYAALHGRYVSALADADRVNDEKKRRLATELWNEA
jgi:hypothetical protein